MPDTRITRNTDGSWTDKDDNEIYPCRRIARERRRAKRGWTPFPSQTQRATSIARHPYTKVTTSATFVGTTGTLTSLQRKVLDKLTNQQAIDYSEALAIATSFGYNAAASYGHMRVAGAAHDEARNVIGLGFPDTSLKYGQLRAAGKDHTSALAEALR